MATNQAHAAFNNWMKHVKKDRVSNEYLDSRDYRFGFRKTDLYYKGSIVSTPKGVHMPGINARGTVGP
jgi:hypothetical protein